jgi:hypothetical protein
MPINTLQSSSQRSHSSDCLISAVVSLICWSQDQARLPNYIRQIQSGHLAPVPPRPELVPTGWEVQVLCELLLVLDLYRGSDDPQLLEAPLSPPCYAEGG